MTVNTKVGMNGTQMATSQKVIPLKDLSSITFIIGNWDWDGEFGENRK
jgi:hypothetical protein